MCYICTVEDWVFTVEAFATIVVHLSLIGFLISVVAAAVVVLLVDLFTVEDFSVTAICLSWIGFVISVFVAAVVAAIDVDDIVVAFVTSSSRNFLKNSSRARCALEWTS